MRYGLIGWIVIGAACTTQMPRSGSAPGDVALPVVAPSASDLDAAYAGTLELNGRMLVVDNYVQSIEARLPSVESAKSSALTKKSVTLSRNAFSDVTDEQFERMDVFYDGSMLKRLRLVPSRESGDEGAEEFYFSNGKLVYMYYEPDGARKPDPHAESGGDRYYFGQEGLIAWVRPDGSRVDPSDPDFQFWSKQLLKEAERFPREVKAP